jgi:cytidylate kinase
MSSSHSSSFQIAIDGPVAAGKGTVSRLVAERLNLLYVDTGAMYRMAALVGIRHEVDLDQQSQLLPLIQRSQMEMRNPTDQEQDGRLTSVFLNGEDVSWQIRTEQISTGASQVAVHPQIRQALVKKQQQIAQKHDVIMEGRDITYKVLPQADLKIFLTADEVVRAKRRHFELLSKGVDVEFDEVYQDLIARDKRDKERETDPLQKVPDAWAIDTSDLSIEKVVQLIVAKARLMRS